MTDTIENTIKTLDEMLPEDRQAVFDRLKETCISHPLERDWNASAEVILDAIAQSTDLTQRGVKGVIADRAFHRDVLPTLANNGWKANPIIGDQAFDADLSRGETRVTVQIKMQRREKGMPLEKVVSGVPHWVVEVQRTRSGKSSDGGSTRPYPFESFDILAVNLYASTGKWSSFIYTVGNWLISKSDNTKLIAVHQPVSQSLSNDWTFDFDEAVRWLLSGERRSLKNFDSTRKLKNASIQSKLI